MLDLIPHVALPVAILAAWSRRRTPLEAAVVHKHLNRAFLLAVIVRALFEAVRSAPASVAATAALFADLGSVVLLWDLARLAFLGPQRRWSHLFQLVAGLLASFLLWVGGREAVPFFLWLALAHHPWLSVLRTGERLRASLLSLGVALAWWFGTDATREFAAGRADPDRLSWLLRSLVVVVAAFGATRAFGAFTKDPTLGIRRVGHRLLLSHVLVVTVPLCIVVVLWISSTYLGVNADRALVAARVLTHETERLEAQLTLALRTGLPAARAANAVASLGETRWPGARAYVVQGRWVERVLGDSTSGERGLAGWVAGLDSLPGHGVVQLAGQRWIGAAVREGGSAAVVLFPIRTVLDSTLAPLTGSHVSMPMFEGLRAAADSVLEAMEDSLRTAGGDERERDSVRLTRSRERARELARRFGIPDSNLRERRGSPIVIASEEDTLVGPGRGGGFGLTGQVQVTGVTQSDAHWHTQAFVLTVRASFRSTLVGLFEKVRENPLQAIPLAALAGLALLLVPFAQTNLRMVRGMGGSIAQGMAALREGAREFGEGRWGYRIPVAGDDDLWDTARQFNQMAEGLERAQESEKERARFESELEVARRIQARLLPTAPPEVPGLDIAGLSESAREIGGDYFDHLDLGGGRLLLVVADVAGKGVPAALLMSGFRAALISQGGSGAAPAEMAASLNGFLHRSVEPGRFVTAFLGLLDAASGRFVYVNAGHNPPVLLREGGGVEMLTQGGLILGIFPDAPFESGEAVLGAGDLLALYSDGVTEGADASGEQWGEERLVALLRETRGESSTAIASRVVRDVRTFEGESGPADDITVLIVRKLPVS